MLIIWKFLIIYYLFHLMNNKHIDLKYIQQLMILIDIIKHMIDILILMIKIITKRNVNI